MPTRKTTNTTERKGVNFIRKLFEDANCVFKEVNKEHDYGHDAFVLLVDGEKVTPREIALQIKSGSSYCRAETCSFSTTADQLEFWRQHPLRTLGVIFDPNENCAYWIDLKAEANERRFERGGSQTITFRKEPWNRVDRARFRDLFLPSLLGKYPAFDLDLAIEWTRSENYGQHELGLSTLIGKFLHKPETWEVLFDLFDNRKFEETDPHLIWALAHIPTHYDLLSYFSTGSMPKELRILGRERIAKFGRREVLRLLQFVDDGGFERATIGQSVGAIISIIDGHETILREISKDRKLDKTVRAWAKYLVVDGIGYPMLPR